MLKGAKGSHSAMTIALPVAIGSLPIGATPVRFKQTQAPVAALRIQSPPSSSSASVDWVKVTDGEFFQTDSRPIMLFDGVCNLCNGGVRFVCDNDRNRSHGPFHFLLRFPPFLRW
ncbi:DCC family protein At1g52590, chloroplastic-like isoform X1 [Zingiber officinale]|uniref:DCC family protein At1g52590, chloroplastic-like isoform X1 n=3 Tax=Zingiber officinale TaxID=94328 RepID=UPI001C4D36F5|nr:DCC family protein At1g52590, chloroplastic-like isoform X1 [Zingiber officinale]